MLRVFGLQASGTSVKPFYLVTKDSEVVDFIQSLAAIVGLEGYAGSVFDRRIYSSPSFVFYLEAGALIVILLLRMFQCGGSKSLLATLALIFAVCIGLAVYDPTPSKARSFLAAGMTVLIPITGYFLIRARRAKRKSVLVAAGVNLFTLLVASAPIWVLVSRTRAEKLAYQEVGFCALIGVALLLAFTPLIQGSYIAQQVNPE